MIRRKTTCNCFVLAALLAGLGATPASAAIGDLTQLPGTLGCLQQTVGDYQIPSPRCQRVFFPGGPHAIELSPDGRQAYVFASDWSASGLVIFDRDSNGILTEKTGPTRCVTSSGNPDADGVNTCEIGRHVSSFGSSAAFSLDGKYLYIGGDGIAILQRDLATGTLTQKPGTAGCLTSDGSPEDDLRTCAVAPALGGERAMQVSPDGKNLYVAVDKGVAIFDRDVATGALSPKAGTAGCISPDGSPAGTPAVNTCVDGKGLAGASSIGISPDGTSVYVAGQSSNALAILDRDIGTGALTQKPGTAACVSQTGGPVDDPCVDGKALLGPSSVTVSADGKNVYVASGGSRAVAVFDRDTATGAVTQKDGRAGCVSQHGSPSGDPVVRYCLDAGPTLDGAKFVRESPDGANVYVAYGGQDPGSAVAWLDRNRATGALRPGGCISDGGTGGVCTVGAWAGGFTGTLAVSADGKNVYGTGNDFGGGFVAAFARERDLLAPETSIISGPATGSSLSNRSATFTFTSTEPASTSACSVDGGPLTACSSPLTLTALDDGQHTFAVQSTDSAGNVDASPASRSFTVDTAPPAAAPPPSPGATASRPADAVTDVIAPRLSNVMLTRNAFLVAAVSTPASARAASSGSGTTFRYTLSEAATVTIVIVRRASGRRKGSRCVAASGARRSAKACTRSVWHATLTRVSKRGSNRVAFSGRIDAKALPPGRYDARLTATDSANNSSEKRTLKFRIVAP
ncbi:MAG: hypothetical protein H0W96_03970 [Solirubrobacterales bacterium]|nr:hypothetical protein [Solirubrobacterales bacterium]